MEQQNHDDLAGISNIDLEAAKDRGIAVCNSPGINAATTAEGALAMMLMLARRVHEQEVSHCHVTLHCIILAAIKCNLRFQWR